MLWYTLEHLESPAASRFAPTGRCCCGARPSCLVPTRRCCCGARSSCPVPTRPTVVLLRCSSRAAASCLSRLEQFDQPTRRLMPGSSFLVHAVFRAVVALSNLLSGALLPPSGALPRTGAKSQGSLRGIKRLSRRGQRQRV